MLDVHNIAEKLCVEAGAEMLFRVIAGQLLRMKLEFSISIVVL